MVKRRSSIPRIRAELSEEVATAPITATSLRIKLALVVPAAKTCVAFSHAGVGQYGTSSRPVAYMPRPKTEWPITLFSRVTFGLGVRDPAMPIPIPGIIMK
jgi:hypothetical protein